MNKKMLVSKTTQANAAPVDDFLRRRVPEAFEANGMPAVAAELAAQPAIQDGESLMRALEALASLAIGHGDLALRALQRLEEEDKSEVLDEAVTADDVLAYLQS
jgi:hypothetical protein